jgi:hypothetical protein
MTKTNLKLFIDTFQAVNRRIQAPDLIALHLQLLP